APFSARSVRHGQLTGILSGASCHYALESAQSHACIRTACGLLSCAERSLLTAGTLPTGRGTSHCGSVPPGREELCGVSRHGQDSRPEGRCHTVLHSAIEPPAATILL